jgi:hypothetical protein
MYANSRGLINSDIAAEASSNAVMAAALPIAQQDAQVFAQRMQQEREFYFTAGLQAFDATIQSGLMAQSHLERMVEMSHQGDINSRLQLEQFGYNWQLNEQQNLHNMKLAALQGQIQAQLALQQFGFDVELMKQDYAYRIKLSDIELRNALRISEQQHNEELDRINQLHINALEQIDVQGQQRLDEIAATGDQNRMLEEERFTRDLQQNYLNAVEDRMRAFSAEASAIWSQPGLSISAQNAAVQKAWDRYVQDLNFLRDQYAKSPYWDDSWGVDPGQMPDNPNTGGDGTGTPPPGGDTGGDTGGDGTGTPPPPQYDDPTKIVQPDSINRIFGIAPNDRSSSQYKTWYDSVSSYLRSQGVDPQAWFEALGYTPPAGGDTSTPTQPPTTQPPPTYPTPIAPNPEFEVGGTMSSFSDPFSDVESYNNLRNLYL